METSTNQNGKHGIFASLFLMPIPQIGLTGWLELFFRASNPIKSL